MLLARTTFISPSEEMERVGERRENTSSSEASMGQLESGCAKGKANGTEWMRIKEKQKKKKNRLGEKRNKITLHDLKVHCS